jgi:hypothetical protein
MTKKKKKSEVQRFKDLLIELGYTNIGEFIELIGGFIAMVDGDEEDQKKAKEIAGPLTMQIGFMIERLDLLDQIIEKNKNLKEELEGKKIEVETNPELKAAIDKAIANSAAKQEKPE